MEYTTVKVPRPTYDAAKRLQAELVRRGIDNIPPKLKELAQDTTCPFCQTQMSGVEVKMYRCDRCGYSRQVFALDGGNAEDLLGMLAFGAILILGVYAVAKLLGE